MIQQKLTPDCTVVAKKRKNKKIITPLHPTSQKKLIRGSDIKKKWEITPYDIKKGVMIQQSEQIRPITKENLFPASLYCILSASDTYKKQLRIYNRLLMRKLDDPKNIIAHKKDLEMIIRTSRWGNNKLRFIYGSAVWWLKSDLPQEIIKDANGSKEKEFELRKRIGDEWPGLWYKGASLLMGKLGYEHVVPIDIWMLRFLQDMGYDVRVSDYETESGLKPQEYFKYEKKFTNLAKKQGLTPMLYQCALWGKFSTWVNPVKRNQTSLTEFPRKVTHKIQPQRLQ